MASLCASCKGKGLCGRPLCPILERFRSFGGEEIKISENIFGASPPSVFVGRYGYPDVSAGPLVPPDVTAAEAARYDNPAAWSNMSIGDILGLRTGLVRSKMRFNVTDASEPDIMLQKAQELSLSEMPVDTEVWFRKPPRVDLRFDGVLTPMGPSGEVMRLEIDQNPVVPRQVDRAVYDTDVKAANAVMELYTSDISVDHITRLLSIGLLGQARKLVPTRWSITATDDMIGKTLTDDVKYLQEVDDILVYSGGLHGNHFEILVWPGAYAFELIEIWLPKAVWSGGTTSIESDWEDYTGKKKYSNLGGGYYAARLPVLEQLKRQHRRASVLAIREITPEYWAPLGVWVVREAARTAMTANPVRFDSIENALDDISTRLITKKEVWMKSSNLLDLKKKQKTLLDFISDFDKC